MISIVSTYKNRRHHIEETLPTWLSQTSSLYEIIIVDYESDDDISSFVKSLNPQIIVRQVRCIKCDSFRLSHARNIGASFSRGNYLLFIDIDTYLSANAVEEIYNQMTDNFYIAAEDSSVKKEIINGGLISVCKKDHNIICGFNESMTGWGFEDIDYKKRLENNGIIWRKLNSDFYTCISHSDDDRIRCYTEEKEISWTKNRQIALRKWHSVNYGFHPEIILKTFGI